MSHPPNFNQKANVDVDISGRRLGNYQLLRRLGRGGMADVYLAEQLSLQRKVAVKVLKRSLSEDDAFVRRFHNEARAAASLVHANIVQIHEVGYADGVHFIAQEYVPGQNLKQWLTRHGPAGAATAVHIMRQVIAALSRAARQGIIHRDIKPENIMLARTGEVKVADFGLARVFTQEQAVGLTQVGVTVGTPLYMSPEQVEGRQVDPRSDLYSLGVTCYEMLTGRPPFEGETPLNIAVQHVRADPKRLEAFRPDLPEGLCRIVHRLLAKSPRDRYATASELMRALRAVPVEGLEQWSASSEEWDTPELMALSEARSAATLQLDTIMKSQARVSGRRYWLWGMILPLVAGSVLGIGVAWWSKPPQLLTVSRPDVERKDTAMLQFWYAHEIDTETGWLAIEKNFPQDDPENRYYTLRAKQQLARHYRKAAAPEKALALYGELARLEEEPQVAASALLGQANVLADQQNSKQVNVKLAEAIGLLQKLTPDQQRLALEWLDAPNVLPLADKPLRVEIEKMRAR